MTTVPSVQIICDGCGASTDVGTSEFAAAREVVAEEGWGVLPGAATLDLCPACRTPTARRHGNDVVVTFGHRVVGRHAFPFTLPPSEWRERLDSLVRDAERAREDAGNDSPTNASVECVVEFVRVESMVLESDD